MSSFDHYITSVRQGPSFQEQIDAIVGFETSVRDFRQSSITVKSLKSKNPLEVLSVLVQCWPAKDIRSSFSYKENEDLWDTSDDFLTDVAEGLELRESKRSLRTSSLVLDIMLQDNLDTFESYNEEVHDHNSQWIGNGCHLYDFDPFTGDESRIKDTYVDIVEPTSMHNIQLRNDASCGDLTRSAPSISRSFYGSIEYRIFIKGQVFTLGYVVTSRDGYLLCYNEVSGTDLSQIVRRVVQEIWGNFKITGYKGAFYEGLSQLFKGAKVQVCRDRENTLPKWCTNKKAKVATSAQSSSKFFFMVLPIFRSVLPFLLFVYGVLWTPFHALISSDDSFLLSKMILSCVLIFVSHRVSDLVEFLAKSKNLSDKIN